MASSSGTSLEQRRWLVVGIALQNVLTPCLREKIQNEMRPFYQHMVRNFGLDKQTHAAYKKTIPPSTVKLNYGSINNNAALHPSPRHYDYCVKDEVSLAKLFMKPFMAEFNAFDSSFDASAALAVLCGAPPFTTVKPFADDVRSKVRNQWAHCDFAAWTEVHHDNCFDLMETLVTTLRFTPSDETRILGQLELWKKQGLELCLGKPLDDTLLRVIRSEVRTLSDSLDGIRQKGDEGSKRLDATLDLFKSEFDQAMALFEEKQSRLERSIDELKYSDRLRWDHMESLCKTLEKEVGVMRTRLDEKSSSGDSKLNVFDAPDHNKWFTGREKEVESLEKCLSFGKGNKLKIAAICGLGGCGKTTLAAHVAWKHKHAYEGGVFWVSMEDSDKFENSINDLALRLKLMADSFALTLSKVLTYLSQQRKSWLMVLDNVDQLELSDEMHKILSGRWKRQAAGHLLLTTRREPKEVCECIDLQPSCCVEVFSFSEDEAKRFLVNRRGVCYSTEREKTLNELVRELGCLPLALEQAGAHIKALQCPISKYLDQYRIERLRLLSQHPAKPSWEYESKRRSAVHTTWLLNFEYIKNSAPHGEMASRFVQAAAFLNPDEIQEVLINPEILSAEDPTCQNCNLPLAKHHIVTLLTKFSLFQRKSSRSFRLHRLVQDVIRDGMTINEKAAALIMSFRLLFDAFGSPARTRAYISESTQGHVAVSVGSPSLAHCFKIKCHLTSLLFLELSGIETETLCRTLCTADVYELLIPEVKRELEDRQKQKEERLKELREELPDDTKRLKKEMKHLHEESQKWDEVALALKEERKQVCEEVLSPQQEKRAKEYEQRLSFVEEERKQTEEEMSLLEEDLQLNEKTKKVAKAVISLLNKNITLFEEIRTLFEGEKELMKEILKHSTCFIGRAILSKRRAMLEKNI